MDKQTELKIKYGNLYMSVEKGKSEIKKHKKQIREIEKQIETLQKRLEYEHYSLDMAERITKKLKKELKEFYR